MAVHPGQQHECNECLGGMTGEQLLSAARFEADNYGDAAEEAYLSELHRRQGDES